jgi:cobalt-zinc-cadmium efflux system outer membrane protein
MKYKKIVVLIFLMNLLFLKNTYANFEEFLDEKNGYDFNILLQNAIKNNKILDINNQNKLIDEANIIQLGLYDNPNLEFQHRNNFLFDKNNAYTFNLQYTQPFEFSGKRNSILKVSNLELENTILDINYKKQQFILNFKSLYINTLLDIENLKFDEKVYNLSNKILNVNMSKFKYGEISLHDLNSIKIENIRLKTQIININTNINADIEKLKLITSMNNIKLKTIDLNKKVKIFSVDNLYLLALENNYELKLLNINKKILDSETEKYNKYISNTKFISAIQLQKNEGFISSILLGLSSDIPVYNRNQGLLIEIEALKKQNDFKYKLLSEEIKNNIQVTVNKINHLEKTLAFYEKDILLLLKNNLEITEKSFNLGEIEILDYILEQNKAIDIQKEYISYVKEYNLAIISLEKIIGILDIIRI